MKKLILFLSVFAAFACKDSKSKDGTSMPISVGIQNSPSNSLMIIADEKSLFDTTKVKVSIKEFAAGKLALQALLGNTNDLDVAVSAETPVALSSLAGNQIKVIGQIVDAKNECRMVVRKDGNLDTPEKYFSQSRKIATSVGGSPEWATYNFIKKYNIKNKVQVLSMDPPNMPIAIAQKAVDGILIFDPFARIAEKDLAEKGLTFLNDDLKSYYVMSVKSEVFSTKKTALKALVEGLTKAEEFIKSNPKEAQQIIAKRTKLDIDIVSSTWNKYSFGIRLDVGLSALCDAEAVWAIETGKYPKETKLPAFKNIITDELLKK